MKVALLGTGLMGLPMAVRLLEAGHEVSVYNRTASKAEPLRKRGAHVASRAGEAVARAQGVILMLSDAGAIDDVLFKDEVTVADKTFIQMGTITSAESKSLCERIENAGGQYLECPVLGSKAEAAAGKLILMVGSNEELFVRWQDFFKAFGPEPRRIGSVGAAATLKLALNQLIASLAATFSLSLGMVQKSGIDEETFMKVLRPSALYAPMFDKKMPRMLERNYENPNFPVKHLLKDVDLFLVEAGSLGLAVDHLQGIRNILVKTVKAHLGDGDYSALFEAVNPPNT